MQITNSSHGLLFAGCVPLQGTTFIRNAENADELFRLRARIISLNLFLFISIINCDYQERIMPVDCIKCAHFKITWIKAQPYGCKLFGFKSKGLPSVEVFNT